MPTTFGCSFACTTPLERARVSGFIPWNGEFGVKAAICSSRLTTSFTALVVAGNTALVPQLAVVCASVGAAPDTQPPSVPGKLTVTSASASDVGLSWTASTDNNAVTGYRIYRDGLQIGSAPGTALTYKDSTVSPSKSYNYEVTAVDAAGNESGKSYPAARAATPAAPTTQTFAFDSAADVTLDQVNGTTNYGSDTKLVVDGSPVDDFLLKFNLSTTGCSAVTSATLRLTDKADGSVKGGDFYATASGWSEGTVNWSNAPARGVLLNSLGAVASVLCGVLAGHWIRSCQRTDAKAFGLFYAGGVILLLGWVWSHIFPINKSLWTSSYVLLSAGIACLVLSVIFWLVDIEGYRSWTVPFLVFGTNAITAYWLSTLCGIVLDWITLTGRGEGEQVVLKTYLYDTAYASWLSPANASLAYAVSYVVLWLGLLSFLYRRRIFIRI